MRKLLCLLSPLILAALIASPSYAGEYYVWVDENGVKNFSQKPPPGLVAEQVSANGRPSPAKAEPAPVQRGSRPGAPPAPEVVPEVDPDALIAGERAAVEARIAEQKQANCDNAKKNLTSLLAFQRIRVVGDDGEERLLSEEEKAEKTETARQVIRENCTAG